jgi:hypothetical protein
VTRGVQRSFNDTPSAFNAERPETTADHRNNPEICTTTLYVPLPVFDADIAFAAETAARTIGKKLKHSEFLVVRTGILKHPAILGRNSESTRRTLVGGDLTRDQTSVWLSRRGLLAPYRLEEIVVHEFCRCVVHEGARS